MDGAVDPPAHPIVVAGKPEPPGQQVHRLEVACLGGRGD
jgi:hypothetical protein